MSSDRDTTRIVRSWLDEGVTQLPDRVLDAVLDQVPATPQRRAGWPARRSPLMNKIVGFGLAAAAVVAVVLIGSQFLGPPGNVGGPGTEPTPEPTPEATPEPTPEGLLPEGSYALLEGPVAIDVTIPGPGWSGDSTGGGILLKNDADPPDGAGLIVFDGRDDYYVYSDPCQWSTTRPDTPSTTVDELVAALSAQASRDASTPVDISVDGYAGKSITLHVPDDAVFDECDLGFFASWGLAGGTEHDLGRYHQGPGQIDKLWILDVDGRLLVMDTSSYAGTPQAVVNELDAIVQSATFEAP